MGTYLKIAPQNENVSFTSVAAAVINASNINGNGSGLTNVAASSSLSASYANYAVSASYAATASSANDFLVRGTLTAQTIVVQVITSSTEYITGSTRFGSLLSNTHQFTGSVLITGSLTLNNSNVILTNQTSSMSVASASYATYAQNVSASGIMGLNLSQISTGSITASVGVNGASFQIISGSSTLMYVSSSGNVGIGTTTPNAKLDVSGSAIISGSLIVTQGITGSITSASYATNATTASYVTTLNQNVLISGSLTLTGSGGASFGLQTGSGGVIVGYLKFEFGRVYAYLSPGNYANFCGSSFYEPTVGSTYGTNLYVANSSAANSSNSKFGGTWFTGGTSTTTKPHVLIEPTGVNITSSAWSTSGTGLGINASASFVGNLIDTQVNGTSSFKVDSTGLITIIGGISGTAGDYTLNATTGTVTLKKNNVAFISINNDTFGLRLGNTGQSTLLGFGLAVGNSTNAMSASYRGIQVFDNYGIALSATPFYASAILQVDSTTKGFLPPRTATTSSINVPIQGLITYITGSTNGGEGLYYYSSGSITSWTKVLNNTGSQVISGSLTVTQGITGSLFGTASYANIAISSSYPIAVTGSTLYSTNPLSGPNFSKSNAIFLGSGSGQSATNAPYSNFLGNSAGYQATNAYQSNFLGKNAGYQATNAYYSNFLGQNAGQQATNAYYSNFLGYQAGADATNAYLSNFIGNHAGYTASNAYSSNFFGDTAGYNATSAYNSNFIGIGAGSNAINAHDSNFIGVVAGYLSRNANNSIFIGNYAGYNDSVNNSSDPDDYSILIGNNASTSGFKNSIAIGSYATNTAENEMMIGSSFRPLSLKVPFKDATINGLTIGKGPNSLTYNTVVGELALNSITIGDYNLAFGYQSQRDTTTGTENVGVGVNTLYQNLIGNQNTAIGSYALQNNNANNNTAVGGYALFANTTGYENTAVGQAALNGNTTGWYNTALGRAALGGNGNYNTAVGTYAMMSNTVGGANNAFGYSSLGSNTVGNYNVAMGYNSLGSNTSGSDNTAIGREAMQINTIGNCNTACGSEALRFNLTGSYNVAMGYNALTSVNADSNVAMGYAAMQNTVAGVANVALGFQAMAGNSTGGTNIGIGYNTLNNSTNNSNNIAIGAGSMYNLSTGTENTIIGSFASYFGTTANYCVGLGSGVLSYNTADNNTAIGAYASLYNTAGQNNTAVGLSALNDNITGSNNTATGRYALVFSKGHNNTALGYNAGYGTGTNYNISGNNNIFIGHESVGVSSYDDNRTWIGNSSTTSTWLGGSLLLGKTTASSYKLDVSGSAIISGSLTSVDGGFKEQTFVLIISDADTTIYYPGIYSIEGDGSYGVNFPSPLDWIGHTLTLSIAASSAVNILSNNPTNSNGTGTFNILKNGFSYIFKSVAGEGFGITWVCVSRYDGTVDV